MAPLIRLPVANRSQRFRLHAARAISRWVTPNFSVPVLVSFWYCVLGLQMPACLRCIIALAVQNVFKELFRTFERVVWSYSSKLASTVISSAASCWWSKITEMSSIFQSTCVAIFVLLAITYLPVSEPNHQNGHPCTLTFTPCLKSAPCASCTRKNYTCTWWQLCNNPCPAGHLTDDRMACGPGNSLWRSQCLLRQEADDMYCDTCASGTV